MNRVPGAITNLGVGMRRRKHLGWRTFDLKAPDVVAEDPNGHIASSATTGGNSVVTFATACSHTTNDGIDMAVFGVPLTNNYGDPITFIDPFSLKFQIEFIGCTGDYKDTNEPVPCFGMGIGQNASDFDNTNNHFLMQGYKFDSSADPPKLRMYNNRSSGETGQTVNTGSSMNAGHGLQHSTIYVGPAVGSNRDSESVSIISNATQYSGDSYQQVSTPNGLKYDFNDASTFDSDSQVYLYAFFGTNDATYDFSSSGTVPVLTCRLRYLVTSDPGGWGGSGT
tara:strand:- start:186 stop:1028 length:843 start_codon:yes stop_codon:yes gene_type:complete